MFSSSSSALQEIDEADALAQDRVRPVLAVVSAQPIDAQFVKTRPEHAAVTCARAKPQESRLAHEHGLSGLCQRTCRRQATETGAHNERVDLRRQLRRFLGDSRRLLPPEGFRFQISKYRCHAFFLCQTRALWADS